ncbi:MMPL family transporter [Pontiellaceae bacterium B12219]|nr:MMPL family transporter [Pontiellaceae bacterium B12219]
MSKFSLHKTLQRLEILLILVIAAVSVYFTMNLGIEQDNESMQSNEAKSDPAYALLKQHFNSQYELMFTITRPNVCAAPLENDIEWLRSLEGVQQVYFPPRETATPGFISADRQTAGLLITLDPEQSREGRMQLLETLRTEAPDRIEGSVHLVGLPLVKERVAHHIAHDQSVVIPLSVVVMMLMLAVLFRRPAGVVLPMSVVGLSLASTLGIYAACGLELNSITSLLPPVVIVLSVSVAVHLFEAWNHEVISGARGEVAISQAVSKIWKPCVFTAAMTAAGLLSLCMSPIPAVRLFGLFSAIGVSLSVIFAFIILPIALRRAKEQSIPAKAPLMNGFLKWAAEFPSRHPVAILLTTLLISLISIGAATKIQNNTDLIRFFKKSDPTYIAHNAVNRTMGSVRSIDLLMQRAAGAAFNPLEDMAALSGFLKKVEQIPDVVRVDFSPFMAQFVADEGRLVRAQVHLGDIGSARAAEINDRMMELAGIEMGDGWSVEPTGDYYQMVRDSNQLVATLLKSFALSLFVVMGSTCLLFGSIRVLIPAFIPNILPVIWGAGLMGLLGIDLSTGTTMVAAVVIGLAVDDTIHYLHHFQSFKHLPIREATRSTTQRIGHALTASTIVLVGGFWMGAFGSFIPTNTFALLTGCMMISALLCDLLVLPAYMILTQRGSK